jgi:hypothetical protein
VVAALLAAQGGVAVWQHFGDTRYFAWAPNDYLMTYDLKVDVGGRALSRDEIASRYRLSLDPLVSDSAQAALGIAPAERYVWEDPPAEVRRRIRRVEEARPAAQRAHVRLTYQLDAGPVRQWRWPS